MKIRSTAVATVARLASVPAAAAAAQPTDVGTGLRPGGMPPGLRLPVRELAGQPGCCGQDSAGQRGQHRPGRPELQRRHQPGVQQHRSRGARLPALRQPGCPGDAYARRAHELRRRQRHLQRRRLLRPPAGMENQSVVTPALCRRGRRPAAAVRSADAARPVGRRRRAALPLRPPAPPLRPAALPLKGADAHADPTGVLGLARPHGALAAAITNAAPSPVAADAVLTTLVREAGLRSGALACRVAQLATVDCVLIAVAQRTPHQTEAALRATFDAVRDPRMEGQPRR